MGPLLITFDGVKINVQNYTKNLLYSLNGRKKPNWVLSAPYQHLLLAIKLQKCAYLYMHNIIWFEHVWIRARTHNSFASWSSIPTPSICAGFYSTTEDLYLCYTTYYVTSTSSSFDATTVAIIATVKSIGNFTGVLYFDVRLKTNILYTLYTRKTIPSEYELFVWTDDETPF